MLIAVTPDLLLVIRKPCPANEKGSRTTKDMAGPDVLKTVFECSCVDEEDSHCVSGCSALLLISDISALRLFVRKMSSMVAF